MTPVRKMVVGTALIAVGAILAIAVALLGHTEFVPLGLIPILIGGGFQFSAFVQMRRRMKVADREIKSLLAELSDC